MGRISSATDAGTKVLKVLVVSCFATVGFGRRVCVNASWVRCRLPADSTCAV